jgi:hypothetical protein
MPSFCGPRRAPVRSAPLRSAPLKVAPRKSACRRSARMRVVLTSNAPRRSVAPGITVGVASTGAAVAEGPAGFATEVLVSAEFGGWCRIPRPSPAIAKPITMPIPMAAQAAATTSAANTPTHRPTRAMASSGITGQNQGDLTADRTCLAAPTQCTYHHSVKLTGQRKHCTAKSCMHGTP